MINSAQQKVLNFEGARAKKIFTTRLQAHDSLGGPVAGLDRKSVLHSC